MLLFLGLLSCSSTIAECVDDGDCPERHICTEARTCEAVECTASSQCSLHQFCDTKQNTCREGCESDDDCIAGESCQDRECVAYACRDTQLDCEYLENCNDGECVDDPRPHCATCDSVGSCGSNGTCFTFEEGENYCLMTCNPSKEDVCPRGFECADATGFGDYHCVAWCPTLYDLGLL